MIYDAFILLGVIHLLLMLRTDLKKMIVDARHNRFMSGAVAFMFLTNYPGFIMMFALLIITLVMALVFKKYSGMGDIEMLSWAIIGFGVIDPFLTLFYLIWLLLLRAAYMIPMRVHKVKKLPGAPIFLGAFIVTAAAGYLLGAI